MLSGQFWSINRLMLRIIPDDLFRGDLRAGSVATVALNALVFCSAVTLWIGNRLEYFNHPATLATLPSLSHQNRLIKLMVISVVITPCTHTMADCFNWPRLAN